MLRARSSKPGRDVVEAVLAALDAPDACGPPAEPTGPAAHAAARPLPAMPNGDRGVPRSAYHGRMCGRPYETYTEEELAFQYLNRRPLRLDRFHQTYNLAPTQSSPVVLVRNGQQTIELCRWGLIPDSTTSLEAAARYSLINARGEDIAEKRSYAQAYRHRRCIVTLSGFYEWKSDGPGSSPLRSTGGTRASCRWRASGNTGTPRDRHPFSRSRSSPHGRIR